MSAQVTMGLLTHEPDAYEGSTLFSALSSGTTYLIDNCGNQIRFWNSPESGGPTYSAYLYDNGNLIVSRGVGSPHFQGGGRAGRVELFNWEGDLIWTGLFADAQMHQHHDIEPLPNGNFLMIVWTKKTVEEAEAAGRVFQDNANEMWPDAIYEIEPVGTEFYNIVWEWHVWDHLVQEVDPEGANYGIVSEHPELFDVNYYNLSNNSGDWNHFNGIDYHAELDQIAISSRHFNEIYIIDHSTTTAEAAGHTGGNSGKGGDILYRWGNPEVYQRGDEDDFLLYGQHDVRWIPEGYPGEGNLMVFNNGISRPGPNYSSVDTWAPPLQADGNYTLAEGAPYGPEGYSYSYSSSPVSELFSPNISGAMRLPNGNTLLCEGQTGYLREVDPDEQIVWEYINPVSNLGPMTQGNYPINNSVFKVERYAPEHPAFEGRDLTPMEPIELEPIPMECFLYTVATEASELANAPRIAPNPFSDRLFLEMGSPQPARVCVRNAFGKTIFETTIAGQLEVNTAEWAPGLYVVQMEGSAAWKVVRL